MPHATFATTPDLDEQPSRPLTSDEDDIHAWAMERAELVRLGRVHDLDIDNLIDEVEDVGRRERKELVSPPDLVFQHSPKWDFQPERRSASRARIIREARIQLDELLDEARSLRTHLSAVFGKAHRQGRVAALNESGLPDPAIPESNPYSWDEIMTRPVDWPEP